MAPPSSSCCLRSTDYTVDQFGNFTPITLAAGGTTVDIFFEEEFPAYQCSIDQINWSPLLMLDTARPYPDNATSFPPIAWSTNSQGLPALPITDEIGTPTGLYIEIGPAVPTQTYLLEASARPLRTPWVPPHLSKSTLPSSAI